MRRRTSSGYRTGLSSTYNRVPKTEPSFFTDLPKLGWAQIHAVRTGGLGPTEDGLDAAALRFGEPWVMAVLGALVGFVYLVAGFANRQLA
jgi:hypothetical protein